MARPSSFRLLKFKTYLNACHNYTDTRPSLNYVSERYLRGSRYSKDNSIQDELKFQRLLRTLKYGSKPLEPGESLSAESISTELQENLLESDPDKEIISLCPEDLVRKLEEKFIPLKGILYTRQLERKYKKSLGVLRVLGKKLQFLKVPLAMGNDQLPCPVDIVLKSPVTEDYRNRDEFSIGLGLDGNEKTVGYFLDMPTEFSTPFCASAKVFSFVRESHKKFVEEFEKYLRLSPLAASQHFSDKGYWKNLMVRSNCAGDLMVVVIMHPQDLTQEEIQAEKEKLKEYFSNLSDVSYNLQSLYFQTCTQSRCTHEQSPFELLLGDPCIVEESNGLALHVSPDSYFHINTKAAELVLDSLLRLCRVGKSTSVIDIGCSVGAVSLVFSPRVKKCIGIDDSMQAIIDAKLNAMENRIQNAEFIYGQPEVLLNGVLDNEYHEDMLVVLNSSRYVITKHVIRMLREHKSVNKIVYISTKPQSAVDNYIQLCTPCGLSRNLGKAFLPIMALPFDLCPNTEQYGLIVMFQRL